MTLTPSPELGRYIRDQINNTITPLTNRVSFIENTNAQLKEDIAQLKEDVALGHNNIDILRKMQITTIGNTNSLAEKVLKVHMRVDDVALQNQKDLRRQRRPGPYSRGDRNQLLIFNKDNLPRLLVASDLFNLEETELLENGAQAGRYVGLLRDVLQAFYKKKGYSRVFNEAWKVKNEGELQEFLEFAGGAGNFVIDKVGSGEIPRYRFSLERRSVTGLKETSPFYISD